MAKVDDGGAGPGDENRKRREARLAEELRANLARRKDQARARRAGEPDGREGIGQSRPDAPGHGGSNAEDKRNTRGVDRREPDDAG